jgi:hypothetical protein
MPGDVSIIIVRPGSRHLDWSKGETMETLVDSSSVVISCIRFRLLAIMADGSLLNVLPGVMSSVRPTTNILTACQGQVLVDMK